MYFLHKLEMFHCYVSLPEGTLGKQKHLHFFLKLGHIFGVHIMYEISVQKLDRGFFLIKTMQGN